MENLIYLPADEAGRRIEKVQSAMAGVCDGILVCDNADIYYLTGRIFSGWAYIPANGEPQWFVRRPADVEGPGVHIVHKPEEIPALLPEGMHPAVVGFEEDIISYNMTERLKKAFTGSKAVDCTPVMRTARSVKTDYEVELVRRSGVKHVEVYSHIPRLYEVGMTDYELQIAIEELSRRQGCLGQFRISGQSMEFFMGNVLSGENADSPSPYDFTMGGKGMNPSLPVGASGEEIRRGTTVMVDVNGNYTGYMTDMTRVYSLGTVPEEAVKAHRCSLDIHDMFRREAVPGVKASELYEKALGIARAAGLERYYMGHRQHAGFVGHGLGIEINEWPVIAPRSRQILAENNVIALEPKFVIPEIGAVGIENTYVIRKDHAECLTPAPEEILPLEVGGETNA